MPGQAGLTEEMRTSGMARQPDFSPQSSSNLLSALPVLYTSKLPRVTASVSQNCLNAAVAASSPIMVPSRSETTMTGWPSACCTSPSRSKKAPGSVMV